MIQRQEIQTGFARIIRELEAPICMAVFRIRARSTKDKIINIIIVIVIIIIIFVIIIEDKSSEELFFRTLKVCTFSPKYWVRLYEDQEDEEEKALLELMANDGAPRWQIIQQKMQIRALTVSTQRLTRLETDVSELQQLNMAITE